MGIQNININSVEPEQPENNSSSSSSRRGWINYYGLKFKDHRQIVETIPGIERVLPVHLSKKGMEWKPLIESTLFAVEPDYFEVFGLEIASGRALSPRDEEDLAHVCVVRSGLLQELGIYEDPVGYVLTIEDQKFTIVGVLRGPFSGLRTKGPTLTPAVRKSMFPIRRTLPTGNEILFRKRR